MIPYISLILLAFAVSLDSFSVGLTYGLRKMHMPLRSISIIACCSAVSLLLAMLVGTILMNFLSPAFAETIGGSILILLGIWVLYQFFRASTANDATTFVDERILFNLEIKSLGVVINILRKPTEADFDRSGSITGLEAFFLGVALSLDAFGAGIGAALLGYSPWLMAISVAVMSSLFVITGIKLGKIFSAVSWINKFSFLPGVLLIIIGIIKM
ncbi:sporulation membrane protein YtaF [Sutcliffiella horikoshii]|uniref:sporulation membrane protein YtaF n=1 Tax=Sutcliffiella horikoshii TaxID=79883 RepID=UPI0007D077E4|nr:sporulation membrane protein YtaF [Sutcliffiella horikoshii]MCM3619412.1 sporulation membrane protein YtaF [Sutcliffiella horikoshii]